MGCRVNFANVKGGTRVLRSLNNGNKNQHLLTNKIFTMKMKSTLLAAAVALFGLTANAQFYQQHFATMTDMTKLLTPSNSTSVSDAKLPGVAITGSQDHKNVLIKGEAFKDNVYGKYGPDEKTIGVYADGSAASVRFRFNVKNKGRNGESNQCEGINNGLAKTGWELAYVKLIVGPKPEGATSDVLKVRMDLASETNNKKATVDGEEVTGSNKSYTVSAPLTPITLTNETQVLEIECPVEFTGEWYNNDCKDPINKKTLKLNYVDVYVEDVATGQFLALESFGCATRKTPKVGFETKTTRKLGFWGDQEVEPGTIFIQAEDFDGYREGEEKTFAGYCLGIGDPWTDGYGYPNMPKPASHWGKGDMSNVRIDAAQNKTGYGIFQQNPGDFSSQNAGLGFALCGMSRVDGGWGSTYAGEYLDETSNKISFKQAIDGFGTWFEYTFEMEEDGYVDISLSGSSHNAFYSTFIQGGTRAVEGVYPTTYNKPRAEGGYVVEGLDDDFLKLYGFCYILSLDGEEQRTNWEGRGMPHPRTGAISMWSFINPFEWTSTQEEDENGHMVNSKFLPITPPFPAFDGNQWFPLYRSDILYRQIVEQHDDGSGTGTMVDSDFKKKCDELTAELGYDYFDKHYKNRPDYIDIPCSAGKHKIRVQSTGGCTIFDEIRITAHKDRKTPSGIENIVAKRVMEEFNGEPEYFDLQGRRVANPGAGLWIVKRGNSVTKEVLR